MTGDTSPSIRRMNPPELGTPPGYSQIVEVSAGKMIFIAGQTALDRDGHVVGPGDLKIWPFLRRFFRAQASHGQSGAR